MHKFCNSNQQIIILSDVPTAPSQIRAFNIFAKSCDLEWQPSVSDGRSPLLGYQLERRVNMSGSWNRVTVGTTPDTSYHIRDLVEGNTYEFRVVAENRVGTSQPSPSTQFVAKDPWSLPGKPGVPKVSDITKRSCKLTWAPPSDDGGDEIRNYIIEYKAAGKFRYTRANEGERVMGHSYKVTGLDADDEYEFRVAAENRAGSGPWSEVTLPVRTTQPEGKWTLFSKLWIFIFKVFVTFETTAHLKLSDIWKI